MATVRVKSFTVIRDVLGAAEIEVEVAQPETVQGLFSTLARKYGESFREKISDPNTGEMVPFPVRLNDEIISSTLDRDRAVKSGDEITIIFPVGGGC